MAEKLINGVDTAELLAVIQNVGQNPSLGRFQFRATNRWVNGGHSKTTIDGFYGAGEEQTSITRPFMLEADEPEVLLGADQAPNPVELLLTALTSCVTSSMVYHAAARGIRLEAVESELSGEIDLRGFLGLSDEIRKGYRKIDLKFRVKGDGTPEQLAELCHFSPVLDVVSHGTQVSIDIQKQESPVRERPADLSASTESADSAQL